MRANLRIPSSASLASYLRQLAHRPFNYQEQKATLNTFPPSYDHDRNRILLGTGSAVFAKAKQHLKSWQHFPRKWTKIYTEEEEIQVGMEVIVLFRLFGLWWRNGARVVYIRDENSPLPSTELRTGSPHSSLRPAQGKQPLKKAFFGFAYGTLKGHIEQGEEIFYVSMEADGQVYYGIQAFSKPDWWPVRLAYPIARYFQRQFVVDSMQQMLSRHQVSGIRDQAYP